MLSTVVDSGWLPKRALVSELDCDVGRSERMDQQSHDQSGTSQVRSRPKHWKRRRENQPVHSVETIENRRSPIFSEPPLLFEEKLKTFHHCASTKKRHCFLLFRLNKCLLIIKYKMRLFQALFVIVTWELLFSKRISDCFCAC